MTNNIDLNLSVGDSHLNIRVVVLIKTPKGYIFEKHKDGYMYLLGGRVKINETSQQAACREVFEELNLQNLNLSLKGIIENFFNYKEVKVHEINFVYTANLPDPIELSLYPSENNNLGFHYIQQEDLTNYDIRPNAIHKLISNQSKFIHLTQNN